MNLYKLEILIFLLLNFLISVFFIGIDNKIIEDKRKEKPSIVKDKQFCQACISIVVGSMKQLIGKRSETDIEFALSEIFEKQNMLSNIY